MHQGKQVYRFGSQQIYIDRSVLFMMRPTQHWVPVSLQALLDCARWHLYSLQFNIDDATHTAMGSFVTTGSVKFCQVTSPRLRALRLQWAVYDVTHTTLGSCVTRGSVWLCQVTSARLHVYKPQFIIHDAAHTALGSCVTTGFVRLCQVTSPRLHAHRLQWVVFTLSCLL